MERAESCWSQISSAPPISMRRLVSLEGYLTLEDAATMIRRALNCVDARLVDHGLRVAMVFDAMMEVSGMVDMRQRRALYLLSLLHDIGAYRTEEIDRMVMFETDDVWEHSFYGYLFFKELSPLAEYANVILCHHMPNEYFTDQTPEECFLSRGLRVADRVDVLLLANPQLDSASIAQMLSSASPSPLFEESVELFAEANEKFGLVEALRSKSILDISLPGVADFSESAMAGSCVRMLVHVIDFRSRHTVVHTVTTACVAYQLACYLLPSKQEAERVYFSALLHDLGKIGTPLSILEKPGRLEPEEMAVMRHHVLLTQDIISGCVADDIENMAVRHHEKLNGSGYPCGLVARELSLPERILAVADIVSALVGTRSYKESYPKEKVLSLLATQADDGFVDQVVVNEVALHYDAIMDKVDYVSQPVIEAHERVQQGYLCLLEELSRARNMSESDPSPLTNR